MAASISLAGSDVSVTFLRSSATWRQHPIITRHASSAPHGQPTPHGGVVALCVLARIFVRLAHS
eukprot:2652632-Pyramimonas_sp.AAC.1